MDEWLNYLYVMGVLNEDDYNGNTMLKNLVYEYNNRFPEHPLFEDFFFDNTIDEQIRKLSDAISNYEPIKGITR